MSSLQQPSGWALAFTLAAAALLSGCASTPAGRDWQVIEGSAITVYTDGSAEAATELYRELERFRAAAMWFTNLEKANVGKLRVMAFKSGTDAIPYLVDKEVGGWASMTVDGNLAVAKLASKTNPADRQSLKRDLVKMWMDYAGVRAPVWYGAGLAELVSAFNVQESGVTIGGLPPIELAQYAELIADEKKGAMACIVVMPYLPYFDATSDWEGLAWWIHDHVPGYSELEFFTKSKILAFNVGWHEEPRKTIHAWAPHRKCLTKPGMENHLGNHANAYQAWLAASEA